MLVAPLSDILGVRVTGVNSAKPVREDVAITLNAALDEHQVLVLPAQRHSTASFMRFSRLFGAAEPHVIDTFHHRAEPNILVLSNVHRDGKPIGLVDAGTYFHTDYSYLEVPARCTILYAIQMPAMKCGTTFANQRRAYEALPEDSKSRLHGLTANHHYGNRNDLDLRSRTVASVLTADQKDRVRWVKHPLVREHPGNGKPNLYAVSGSSFTIDGMADDESLALLEALRIHSTQEKYCYTHDYQVGDVIIWDNCSLLHSAPLTDLRGHARTLWRITVKEQARARLGV